MIKLVPMSTEEREQYGIRMARGYAEEMVDAAGVSEQEAYAIATAHMELDLSEDAAEHCYRIVAAQSRETVGEAAIVLGGADAFLLDFRVETRFHGKGYGSAAMRRIERMASESGASQIRLHVFARNDAARSLYERRGFDVVSLQMRKTL